MKNNESSLIIDISEFEYDTTNAMNKINFIELNKTPYSKITDTIENLYLYDFNNEYLNPYPNIVWFQKSDFIFEWDIDINEIINSVPKKIHMDVSAANKTNNNSSILLTGKNGYDFYIKDNNLKINNEYHSNLFSILGIILIGLFVSLAIILLIKKLFLNK